MALSFKCFCTLLVFLVIITICTATIKSVATKFTEKKIVATSHTTLQNISKIKCVERCNQDRQSGQCTLAGYNKSAKTCYLSVDNPQDVLNTTDEMSGVFFFGMIKEYRFSLNYYYYFYSTFFELSRTIK